MIEIEWHIEAFNEVLTQAVIELPDDEWSLKADSLLTMIEVDDYGEETGRRYYRKVDKIIHKMKVSGLLLRYLLSLSTKRYTVYRRGTLYMEHDYEVGPCKKPKLIMDTTNNNLEWKAAEMRLNDAWSERGSWNYKKGPKDWKTFKKYQWGERCY